MAFRFNKNKNRNKRSTRNSWDYSNYNGYNSFGEFNNSTGFGQFNNVPSTEWNQLGQVPLQSFPWQNNSRPSHTSYSNIWYPNNDMAFMPSEIGNQQINTNQNVWPQFGNSNYEMPGSSQLYWSQLPNPAPHPHPHPIDYSGQQSISNFSNCITSDSASQRFPSAEDLEQRKNTNLNNILSPEASKMDIEEAGSWSSRLRIWPWYRTENSNVESVATESLFTERSPSDSPEIPLCPPLSPTSLSPTTTLQTSPLPPLSPGLENQTTNYPETETDEDEIEMTETEKCETFLKYIFESSESPNPELSVQETSDSTINCILENDSNEEANTLLEPDIQLIAEIINLSPIPFSKRKFSHNRNYRNSKAMKPITNESDPNNNVDDANKFTFAFEFGINLTQSKLQTPIERVTQPVSAFVEIDPVRNDFVDDVDENFDNCGDFYRRKIVPMTMKESSESTLIDESRIDTEIITVANHDVQSMTLNQSTPIQSTENIIMTGRSQTEDEEKSGSPINLSQDRVEKITENFIPYHKSILSKNFIIPSPEKISSENLLLPQPVTPVINNFAEDQRSKYEPTARKRFGSQSSQKKYKKINYQTKNEGSHLPNMNDPDNLPILKSALDTIASENNPLFSDYIKDSSKDEYDYENGISKRGSQETTAEKIPVSLCNEIGVEGVTTPMIEFNKSVSVNLNTFEISPIAENTLVMETENPNENLTDAAYTSYLPFPKSKSNYSEPPSKLIENNNCAETHSTKTGLSDNSGPSTKSTNARILDEVNVGGEIFPQLSIPNNKSSSMNNEKYNKQTAESGSQEYANNPPTLIKSDKSREMKLKFASISKANKEIAKMAARNSRDDGKPRRYRKRRRRERCETDYHKSNSNHASKKFKPKHSRSRYESESDSDSREQYFLDSLKLTYERIRNKIKKECRAKLERSSSSESESESESDTNSSSSNSSSSSSSEQSGSKK